MNSSEGGGGLGCGGGEVKEAGGGDEARTAVKGDEQEAARTEEAEARLGEVAVGPDRYHQSEDGKPSQSCKETERLLFFRGRKDCISESFDPVGLHGIK